MLPLLTDSIVAASIQFAKQLHGVNGGSNFPSDFLHEIYEAVCNEELKVRK